MTRHGSVIGIAGWSGSGKTSLIVRLLPILSERGYRVATVKHAHRDFDIDVPGKDSYEHRRAGAAEVAVSSPRRLAVVREHRGGPEAALEEILGLLAPADIVLVEGYKDGPHDKIEVWRSACGKPPVHEGNPTVVAVATDLPARISSLPALDLDDAAAVADFVVARCRPGRVAGEAS